jgi:hypothetical protein
VTTVIAYSFASGSILGSPRLATGLPGGLGPGPCTMLLKGGANALPFHGSCTVLAAPIQAARNVKIFWL